MYQSNRSFNIPPRAYPGHLTSFPAREGGNLINLVFPGQAFDHYLLGVGNLIASLDFMLRVVLIPRGVIKSWRRQAFMHSKQKIPDSWRTGWKAKACTSFVLYLKVFKNHLYYLWNVRVLFPDLLNYVYIHSFRSIIKATEKYPGGGGIWSPGMDLWWGIWTAFRPREGDFEQKFSKTSNARGLARGGCWSFDLTGT